MNTQPSQVQLKLSLSEQLHELLSAKAAQFGVPITQFVKHLILKEVEKEIYPIYQASDWLEEKSRKAIRELDKAVDVKDVHKFFKNL